MAKVEDLIKNIPDAQLRGEIAHEVAKLKSEKKFGLVFEEHLPEQVLLPGLPIKPGARVVKRGAESEIFSVLAPNDGKRGGRFRIARETDGQEEVASTRELVVIKKFGEPIYPTLVSVDRVTRAPGKPYHTVINAENFHALQLLLYCYEGQVDVIYIDPPYNTGARDWKYNNRYVDSADQYRHSKWLSMMKKRLLLAKRLLRRDGVLVVTIDDNENDHLQLLLEALTPERLLTTVVIVHNPRGNVSNNFAKTHEYALFLITRGTSAIGRKIKENLSPRKLRRWGHNSTRKARPTMFYPIYVKDGKISRIGDRPSSARFHPTGKNVAMLDGEIEVWPIDQKGVERRWNFSRDTIEDELDRIVAIENGDGEVDLFLTEEETTPKTVWTGGDLEAGKHGASLVKAVVGREFPFPKSVYAVQKCIELVVGDRPNAVVLDFFAGSGTTLHATCILNSQDGGNRKCILVTNNEVEEKLAKNLKTKGFWPGDSQFEREGIAESVTWPRCKYAINGKRDNGTRLTGTYLDGREMKDGFTENAEYFKLDFLDPSEVAYGDRFEAIVPILWLMAGAKGSLQPERGSRGAGRWFIPKESPYAVLIQEDYFAEFKRELKERPDITHVLLVTDSEEAYREMIAELPGAPQTKMLYKSYLENFRINTERNL